MIQLWKRKKKGQRQGSLAIPIHDTLTLTSYVTYGSPEQGFSPQEKGSTTAPHLRVWEKIQQPQRCNQLRGEFSSKQIKVGSHHGKVSRNYGISSDTWEALCEGLCSFPPLPLVYLPLTREVWAIRGRKGPLSHNSLYPQPLVPDNAGSWDS